MAAEAFLALASSPSWLPSAVARAAAWPVNGFFRSMPHGWGSPGGVPVQEQEMTCIT